MVPSNKRYQNHATLNFKMADILRIGVSWILRTFLSNARKYTVVSLCYALELECVYVCPYIK